jgi:nicotinamidase-related amidase
MVRAKGNERMTVTALLIVDLQNDYFEGGKFQLTRTGQAAQNAAALLQAFRAQGRPVVHIRHEILRQPAPFFAPGSEGADIHSSVAPRADELVITKNFPNSFRDTDLLAKLAQSKVTDLVIVGAMSHYCIDATTRAASDLGFNCSVAHDACATRALEFDGVKTPAPQVHAAFMAALAMGYASVVASGEILQGLLD